MSRIKEWWLRKSKKWKLVIIAVPVLVILGVGGMQGSLAYFAANPSACSICHVIVPYVDSYHESSLMDNAHAVLDPPVKCKDCHHATLVQLTSELINFVTGNYETVPENPETPLVQREYEQEFCTSCHPVEDVFEATSRTNRPEFRLNPHWNHFADTTEGEAAIVECQECHRAHRGGLNFCFEKCHDAEYGYAPNK